MKARYRNLTTDKVTDWLPAKISYDDPTGSYGQAVLVVGGNAIDINSAVLLSYQLLDATQDELAALRKTGYPC